MLGIFDSGFGGLSVFKEIYKLLPEYKYIYLGDSARTPYGNRSQEVIYDFTVEALDFLFASGCEVVIIACNTVSAEALRKIQQEYLPAKYPDKRVLGVIRPLVEKALEVSRGGRIGVVGTRSTVASNAYINELNKIGIQRKKEKLKLEIFQQACPLLVPLIEEGWIKKPETKMILKKYLRPLKQEQIDTLILGCTHYPFLIKEFKQIMGKRCNVLDSGLVVAESFKDYLTRHPEIEKKLKKSSEHKFYTTDDPVRFSKLGSEFFGEQICVEKINLLC
jgi:glutamate racemase